VKTDIGYCESLSGKKTASIAKMLKVWGKAKEDAKELVNISQETGECRTDEQGFMNDEVF
jgi:hypothetical protein